MRLKLVPAAVAAALAILLLGAGSASAATEAGNNCVGNKTAAATVIALTNGPSSPLPTTIPSNGVVTRWRVSVIPVPPDVIATETLKILRPTGVPKQFQVVGESAPVSLVSGTSIHATRIPVQAGDYIGGSVNSSGTTGGLFCETGDPGDRAGFIPENPGIGATGTVALEEGGFQLPIVVSIEPDADNDGFGDETQDACPQSATTQGACPAVVLSTTKLVRKGSVTVVVTSSTAAPVTVKGVVKLGKGKKANLNGGTQTLAPGVLGRFTLKFTKKVKAKLKELPPKRSVRLNVTVSGASVAGAITTKALKIKLKGQARP